MKIKTSELTGEALRYATAQAEGENSHAWNYYYDWDTGLPTVVDDSPDGLTTWRPDTCWEQGGPIIEQEKIALMWEKSLKCWFAYNVFTGEPHGTGPTPLIAAMRCYVASKLGDEVEVPDELDVAKQVCRVYDDITPVD